MADAEPKGTSTRGSMIGMASIVHAKKRMSDIADKAKKNTEDRRRRAEYAFIALNTEKWVWITDPDKAYEAAKILKENPDGSMEVEVGFNRAVKLVKKSGIGFPITRFQELKNHVDDMVRMGDVNEATILHNLRMRFMDDLIYTNIGAILVSINPFKWMNYLYTNDLIHEHLNLPPGEISTPHVFQIAAAAYHGLRGEQLNQSIIISGESGAGKTEAAKACLLFFAEAAGSSAPGMEKKLLSANPILEAFGNAKTVRNNNSSRFGKWMEVHFNGRAQICGSQIINYLLEKSRVVFQSGNERNFHIFYHLTQAATPEYRTRFSLQKADHYVYTNRSGCITVEGLHDAEEFRDLLDAFKLLEFPPEEFEQLFQIVAGILHLSNVSFDAIDTDSSKITASASVKSELEHAARLIGTEIEDLRMALELKLIETKTERLRTPLSLEKAIDSRNSMSKALYGRMFDWLVQRVNASMEGSLAVSKNIIGVLDIFGFEIFEINSFEQLCINYCNEKLQQHFNQHVFKAEEKCYKAEEIDYTEVKFIDNQDVLDLVELRPNGLLPRLDDECKVPRGSDQGYLEKIVKTHAGNPRFMGRIRRDNTTRDTEFGVHHYAGPVYYDVRQFMEKNKDELHLSIRELLAGSKVHLIRDWFYDESIKASNNGNGNGAASHSPMPASMASPAAGGTSNSGGGGGGSKDKVSQGFQFQRQLEALMKTLNATEPHYIRCIKPNSVKKPNILDSPMCLQQLRYAGVFEAVKIRQMGYPFRWTHELFYKRYRCCAGPSSFRDNIPKQYFDWKAGCKRLIADLCVATSALDGAFKFGKTMILYRADPHRIIESMRDFAREKAAITVERVYRAHVVRKMVKKLMAVRERIRAAIKSRALEPVAAALAEGRALVIQIFEMKELTRLHSRLVEEKVCRDTLHALYPFDPVEKYKEYESTLKDARRLELNEEIVHKVQAKFNTVRDRIETKTNLDRGVQIGDKQLIMASLERAEELKKDWGDIVSPEAVARAREVLQIIKKEDEVLTVLRNALSVGMLKGAVGALDTSTIETAELDARIEAAASAEIRTTVGHNLIDSARRVRALRLAFKSSEWAAIEKAAADAGAMRQNGSLAPEVMGEVKKAEAEVADRRIIRAVNIALATGAPKGRVGDLNMKSSDVAGLAQAIGTARKQAEDVGGLSAPAMQLLTCAELVLRLRQAMVAGDWGAIRKTVNEALDTKMPDVCLAEIQAAKDELDNHTLVHQLTDALEKGYPNGTVARLDLTPIDVNLLTERIGHAEEVGPKTQQAQALLKLARIVKKVRAALLQGDYGSLADLCKTAATIPKEYVPQAAADELVVAQYEGENVIIVRTLREAITTGAPRGIVGNVARSAINTSVLTTALKKADVLKCRSEEAVWLHEVAETLFELRDAFRERAWSNLQELILAVHAMDKTRPAAGTAIDDVPVLKDMKRQMSRMSTFSNAAFINLLDGTAAAAAATLASRGRTPSFETRDLPGRPGPMLRQGSSQSVAAMDDRTRTASVESRGASAINSPVAAAGAHPSRAVGGDNRRTSVAMSEAASASGMSDVSVDEDATYFLPSQVNEELSLIQAELNNYNTIKEITEALKAGAPSGPIGTLSVAGVDTAALLSAINRAQRMGPVTPLAKSLAYSGRVVRDLREALLGNDWASVDATLHYIATNNAHVVKFAGKGGDALASMGPSIPTSALGHVEVPAYSDDPRLLEEAAITLCDIAMPEVVRIEQESAYRRVMEQMVAALEGGFAHGQVGSIDVMSVTVTPLAAAIDASRALGAQTDRARHLTSLCRLMWQMRTAVLEDDWPSVESLLGASGEVLGQTSQLPPGCSVPVALLEEVELYRGEANNRRLIASLGAALRTGCPTGEIGKLNLSSIDARPIEEALRLTLQLRCATGESKCLASTALHIRSMRLALMSGQWEKLGELLDYLHTAVLRTKPYSYSGDNHAGKLPQNPDFPTPQATNSKDGLGYMGTWPGVMDKLMGFDIMADGVSSLAAREVATMQLELSNRTIIVQLSAAVAKGAASGTIGHLDLTTVETGALEWAIDYSAKIGCATQEAEQMLATAVVVKRIRLALLAGDWMKLEAALTEAQGKVLAEVGANEIRSARDELDNRAILAELASALARGRPQGRTGRVFTGSIDLKPLNDAISLSTKLGPKTVEARQMLFTAKVVARLRMCLLNEDLAEAALTLEAIRGKMLASVAMPEVRMVQDEVDNWTVVAEVTAALQSGGVAGTVGALDLSAIDASNLQKAIEHADELGTKTAEAANLLGAAIQVSKLRTALLNDNWSAEDPEGVEYILHESAGMPLSELARGELSLVQSEVENRRIVLLLSSALAAGAARGPVGEMDLSVMDTAELDAAIAEATELGVKTEEAERLLQSAKLVRRLRAVLLANNWQWVGSVLLEARGIKNIFPQVSLRELQFAQDELDNRAIIAQVTSALRSGGPPGPIGRDDFSAVDVTGIDEALVYARTLGVKATEASQLVATAQVIRKLRMALKLGDLADAKATWEGAKGKTFSAVAADELTYIKQTIDNWVVVSALTTAITRGSASGPVGEYDRDAIQVDALDAAIAEAIKIGATTVKAKQCLSTGLMIRRLREAMRKEDLQYLREVIEEIEHHRDAIIPDAQPEIQSSRDLLEFRAIMDALARATEAVDEMGLIEALARAKQLKLHEHRNHTVRDAVEVATAALGRIQRCKAMLTTAIKSLEASQLIEAIAMAASVGYSHALVEQAKKVLTTVQQLTERAGLALRSMDAVELNKVLRDCDQIRLQIPVLSDIRRCLQLPRGEFLRRELASVLTTARAPSPSLLPHPDGIRPPSDIELRVIQCTLQLKDLFFADQPDTDEALLAQYGIQAPAGLPALFTDPKAQSATLSLRHQKNMDDNTRGAAIRSQSNPLLHGQAWALSPATITSAFKPGCNGVPAPQFIGGATAPANSQHRKQYDVAKFHKLKPAHMFSQKYNVSDSLDSGMLKWQHEPIHTSLTLLHDGEARRAAVKTFRNTLAFMGDRPLARHMELARELLTLGLRTPDLRDEIYLQLIKQLTGNPSYASAERGWVLLHLCLCTFPPSEEFENHLELWLRDHGAIPCVWAMHLTLYRGVQQQGVAISIKEMQAALDRARAPALPSLPTDGPASPVGSPVVDHEMEAKLLQAELMRQYRLTEDHVASSPSAPAHLSPSSYAKMPNYRPSDAMSHAEFEADYAADINQRLAKIAHALGDANSITG